MLVTAAGLAGKAVAVTVPPAWEVVPAVIAQEQWIVAAAVARAEAVLSKALAAVAAPQPAPARAAARVGEVSVVAVAAPEEVVVDEVAEEAAAGVGKASQIPLSGTIGAMVRFQMTDLIGVARVGRARECIDGGFNGYAT